MKADDSMWFAANVAVVLLFATGGCTNSNHSEKVLRGAGYTNIEMTGYEVLGCSKDDSIHDGFRAKDQSGQTITGVVCCGLIGKSCTIRID